MPVTVERISSGKNKGKYKVRTPGGVKSKATTKANAERQKRLINATEHGWKPTGTKARK